jgi:GNAT superfamily N-acetyltransferase
MINIRLATVADHAGIWAMLEPVFRAGETHTLPRDIEETEGISYWCGPTHETFVALENDTFLGTYCLCANHGCGATDVADCGYITASAAQGRGITRLMLEHSLIRAKEQDFRAMQFNFVVSTNMRAIRTWEASGFEVVGRLPLAFKHPQRGFVDALVMYRAL